MTVFFIVILHAENQTSPSSKFSSPLESFGIQRFQKREEAIPFTLKDLNGNQVSLSDFRGKPILLFFWATWCPSCKEDLPLLEKFSIGKRDQMTFLLITVDGERAVRKIINENKVTLPVLLDLKEKVMDYYRAWGWYPQTFLIDREGILVGKIIGQRDWSASEAWSAIKEIFSLH